jgi:hypothetical protein
MQQSESTRHRSPIGEQAQVLVVVPVHEPLQHSVGPVQVAFAFEGTPQQTWLLHTPEQQSESTWHCSVEPLSMHLHDLLAPPWQAPVPGQHGTVAPQDCPLVEQQTLPLLQTPEQQSCPPAHWSGDPLGMQPQLPF